jgi:hypothetical protein
METGCLFYKMRAGKHRLGPDTRTRVEEIDAAGQAAYAAFLQIARDAGTGRMACRSRPGRGISASRSRLPSPNAPRAKTPRAFAKC